MTHKHLEHYEDLVFYPADLNRLLYAVYNNQAEFSIKYDGSPAIVFGTQDKQTFVATKRYFSKSSVRYYYAGDISNADIDYELKRKLNNVLSALFKDPPAEGNVYFGDLLFWERCSHFEQEHRPNLIAYKFYSEAVGYPIGIAVHTQLKGMQPFSSRFVFQPKLAIEAKVFPFPTLKKYSQSPLFDVNAYDPTFFIDYQNWRAKTSAELSKKTVIEFLLQRARKHLESLKTARGRANAQAKYETLAGLLNRVDFEMIQYNMRNVMLSKSLMLKTILPDADERNYAAPSAKLDYKTRGHEGLVIKTPSISCKVVDRTRYSAAVHAQNLNKTKHTI